MNTAVLDEVRPTHITLLPEAVRNDSAGLILATLNERKNPTIMEAQQMLLRVLKNTGCSAVCTTQPGKNKTQHTYAVDLNNPDGQTKELVIRTAYISPLAARPRPIANPMTLPAVARMLAQTLQSIDTPHRDTIVDAMTRTVNHLENKFLIDCYCEDGSSHLHLQNRTTFDVIEVDLVY